MAFSRIHFTPIPVEDQQRALEFYCDVLGMEVEMDAPYDDDWRWIFLKIPGAETFLQLARRSELEMSEEVPVLALVCDDTDAEAERLSKAGVKFETRPTDALWAEGARFALFRDSEGNLILMQSNLPEGAFSWPT